MWGDSQGFEFKIHRLIAFIMSVISNLTMHFSSIFIMFVIFF